MQLLAGTSGYSYAPWKGHFYPEKTPAARMLSYYASRLPTVEINNTFYRMPKPEMIAKWAEEVPPEFRFALKAPKRITHEQRLAGADDSVRSFYAAAATLGPRLGPALFQLPPFMKKDVPKLAAFLALLREVAPGIPAAFEFRHETWFVDETWQALRDGGAALCVSESEDLATPFESTADWGYLRLRRQDYGPAEVAAWGEKIAGAGWREAYVFFKHEDEGKGPKLAELLLGRSAPSVSPAPPPLEAKA